VVSRALTSASTSDVAAALTDIEAAANREAGAGSERGASGGSRTKVSAARQHKRLVRRLTGIGVGVRAAREALRKQRTAASSAIHIELLLGHPEQWEAKELLFDCLDLHYRALEFLHPKHCSRKDPHPRSVERSRENVSVYANVRPSLLGR
jgi:hypothetical protein